MHVRRTRWSLVVTILLARAWWVAAGWFIDQDTYLKRFSSRGTTTLGRQNGFTKASRTLRSASLFSIPVSSFYPFAFRLLDYPPVFSAAFPSSDTAEVERVARAKRIHTLAQDSANEVSQAR